MKLLIAEDCSIIRMVLQEQLTTWGYDFDFAFNGKEAIEYIGKNGVKYDLCLMDMNMPIMNGFDAIKRIRQEAYYLPILACSTCQDFKERCLKVGADEFLLKPLDNKHLKEKIDEFSVKKIILHLNGENLSLHRVGPANSDELSELRKLDEKGLAKFMVIDTSVSFIAHKNSQQKLLHDFSDGNMVFTEIVDRVQQGHSLVQIHASKIWLRKFGLTSAQFKQLVREEDEALKRYRRS